MEFLGVMFGTLYCRFEEFLKIHFSHFHYCFFNFFPWTVLIKHFFNFLGKFKDLFPLELRFAVYVPFNETNIFPLPHPSEGCLLGLLWLGFLCRSGISLVSFELVMITRRRWWWWLLVILGFNGFQGDRTIEEIFFYS